MSNELAPPGVALAALRCFSHEPNYEAILGDLNEEFHQRLIAFAAIVGCVLLMLLGPAVLQAQETNGGRWIGAWTLNVPQSTFGVPLAPGIPPGFMVVSQTLTIEQTAQQFRLFGETVYSDVGGSHTAMDDNQLSLDGTPTRRGPISLTFRLLDNSTFDIVSEVTLGARRLSEVSHFSVSADGQTLTETKTQTERSPGAATDTPGGTGRRSTSVLIFGRRAN